MKGWFVILALSLALTGCRHDQQINRNYYDGPTLKMSELVNRINANNRKIPTLWASNEIEASIVDEKSARHNELMSGNLLYRANREMLLVGRKDPIGRVFELGSNSDVYWMSVKVGPDTAWWGHYRNLGKPCSEPIGIRPDLIMQVLGVATISQNLLEQPAPVMRFNPDNDVYMVVWSAQVPAQLAERWVAVKEVWYDRATLEPRRVLLFNENGRVVLRAFLSEPKSVRVEGAAQEQWPKVATHYKLYFPENRSKMEMRLTDVALVGPRNVPKDASFRFDPNKTGTSKVIQLDAACGP